MEDSDREIRCIIRDSHRATFEYTDRLLRESYRLHSLFCNKKASQQQQRAKLVLIGTWTRMCKQLGGVLILCEWGLTEEAHVIARSLFESTLHTLFVTKKNVRLRRGWGTAPKAPRGRFSMPFRAEIYIVVKQLLNHRKMVTVWGRTPGTRRAARKHEPIVDAAFKQAEGKIGTAWMAWLWDSKKSGGAFQVETMAQNLGMARWYNMVYRTQSIPTHAADAINQFDLSDEGSPIRPRLHPDVAGASGALGLAIELVQIAMRAINGRFDMGLDETIGELANDWRLVRADGH
jgi:hypothetical protein